MNNLDSYLDNEQQRQEYTIKYWYRNIKKDKDIEEVCRIPEYKDRAIKKIIERLKDKSKYKLDFNKIRPEFSFVKQWIKRILNNFEAIDKETVENLIEVFRRSLYTTSLEEGNTIIVLQFHNQFMLALSKRSISIAQKGGGIKIVNRALDEQNVRRYVLFEQLEEQISVRIFEKYKLTKGMSEFLGISPEDIGWELLGDIKIYFDWSGQQASIEIIEEEIRERFETMLNMTENQIIHGGEIYDITHIRMRGKHIKDLQQLWDIILRYQNNLEKYRNYYLHTFVEPKLLKSTSTFKENESRVIEIRPNGKKTNKFPKDHPHLDIIFARKRNPPCKMEISYLNKFYYALFIKDNTKVNCLHIQDKYYDEPARINNLLIYHKIRTKDKEKILDLLDEITQESFYSEDKKDLVALHYTVLKICENIFSNGMKHVFRELLRVKVIPNLNFQFKEKKFYAREEYIEYKRNQWYESSPVEFAKKLSDYIKRHQEDFLIMLVGADEKTKTLEPLSYYKDEFSKTIENKVRNQVSIKMIHVHRIPHNTKDVLLIYWLK
ncbi:MAG: hypothetical protein ACOC44_19430 [Promethearchaeia archaeon]